MRCGSAPEIIDDGVTGIVVDGEADLIPALEAIRRLDRADCRAAAEGRFSLRRMVAEHLAFYMRCIEESPGHRESA